MKIKKVYPADIVSFKCQSCGDCCKGWSISIDEMTYKKYQEKLNEKIEGLEYPYFFENEGVMHYRLYEGLCVFLLNDNKCFIHKNLGTSYKCRTCAVYPRLEFFSSRSLEISLTFSCPAAVDILFNNLPFKLKTKFLNVASAKDINLKLIDDACIGYCHYNFIQKKIIDYISDAESSFSFEKKLYLISFWLRSIFDKLKNYKTNNLKKIIKQICCDFEKEIECLEKLSNELASPASAQFAFLITVLNNARIYYSKNSDKIKKDFFEYMSVLFDFFKIDLYGKYRVSISVKIYKNLYEKHFNDFQNQFGGIIKKYFLYNIIGKRFILNYDIIRGYNMQLVCVSLIKLIAFSNAEIKNEPLHKEHIKFAIRFIERNFMHANRIFTFWSGKENETSLNTAPFSKIISEPPLI